MKMELPVPPKVFKVASMPADKRGVLNTKVSKVASMPTDKRGVFNTGTTAVAKTF
jgi:hypothetical protein